MNYNFEKILKTAKFQNLERWIYEAVCEAARNMTKELLEELDKFLQQTRDAKRYANKQKRKTTIKTVYGEVEYIRHMYYDRKTGHHVYLLDEKLQMEKLEPYQQIWHR